MSPFVQVAWPTAAPAGITYGSPTLTDTSHALGPTSVGIPAGMSGKLCIVPFRMGRNPVYVGTPSGWTRLMPSVTNSPMGVFYRVCNGTEGSSISVEHYSDSGLTTNTQSSIIAAAYAVEGVATTETDFIEAAFAFGDDPPSLTPSWGSAENEWITMYASRYNDWTVSAYPTDYTELLLHMSERTVAIDYSGLAIGRRLLTGTVQDPSVFSITAGANALTTQRTMTLALRPA